MKSYQVLFFAFAFLSPTAFADTLVCELRRHTDPRTYVGVTVNLKEKLKDNYAPNKGLDIADDNYSFDLQVARDKKKKQELEINTIFNENNHVQDEVANRTWTVDIREARRGEPVIDEPLEVDGRYLMDFLCWYND